MNNQETKEQYYLLRVDVGNTWENYIVNSDMCIAKYTHTIRPEKHSFSSDWKLLGFRPIVPFGNTGTIITPQEFLLHRDSYPPMTYANKKGRYVVEDQDHNTRRIWGYRASDFYKIDLEVVQ